jgi:predicted transposase YbfD/YdcC
VSTVSGDYAAFDVPKLLEVMAIEGAIVTIDAMGCQRDIARKILDKKADYVLALKANQGTFREDVEVFMAEQEASDFKDTTISQDETVDGDHGHIETRNTTVIHDAGWLQKRHDWFGLKAIVMVESRREIPESAGAYKIESETRFYITSLVLAANQIGPIVRGHWAVENSLHWVMDMVFRDNDRFEPIMPRPTSALSNTWQPTCPAKPQPKIRCVPDERSPHGMTAFSPALTQHDGASPDSPEAFAG